MARGDLARQNGEITRINRFKDERMFRFKIIKEETIYRFSIAFAQAQSSMAFSQEFGDILQAEIHFHKGVSLVSNAQILKPAADLRDYVENSFLPLLSERTASEIQSLPGSLTTGTLADLQKKLSELFSKKQELKNPATIIKAQAQ